MSTRQDAGVPAHRGGRASGGRLRRLCAAAAVAVAGVGLSAASAVPGPVPAALADEVVDPTRVTLSMAVDPGSPVPLDLITEVAAEDLSADGFTGQGIDVALIDSGVAPVAGLDAPGKVVNGPDLSAEGSQPNLAHLDTYGHGTHLAGVIANTDDGIAPGARIVNVKIAGATGETHVAQVIAGIDWVIQHKNDNGLNIRVLNLSLGVEGVPSNYGDRLSMAVERAWDAGIVVVAAAGNRGNDAAGIDSPAISPYVIAVGGTESYESSGASDVVASWSSGGNDTRTPDVVAPGRSIVSLRVPGSTLDQMYPSAVVGTTHFRGSGTSQSAAVVSGFTALLLSADPSLTNDQVKFLYELYADDIAAGEYLDGSGRLDVDEVYANLAAKADAPVQTHPRAVMGWLDAILGDDWNSADIPVEAIVNWYNQWASSPWSGGVWSGATWSGGQWSSVHWFGATWSGATWSGGVWHGATWSGATWSSTDWSGATWSGATWSGATWSGVTWSGATWSSATWSSATWSAEAWS